MTDTIQLSNSRLAMLARCPKQFEFVYIKGMRRPPDVALAIGRGVDSSVNRNMLAKISGPALPEEEICDIASEAVGLEVEREGLVLSPEEALLSVRTVVGNAKDRAVRLARHHSIAVAPTIAPIAVQRKFEVEIDAESGPIDFVGFADIEDQRRDLHDTKTSAKSPNAGAADSSMQLTAYATMKTIEDGVAPGRLWLETIVDSGKSAPKEVVQDTTRSRHDMLRYLDRARAGAQLIRSGNFYPTDPSNWWCSKRWCGFWDICPHALRPAAVVVGGLTDRAEPGQGEA